MLFLFISFRKHTTQFACFKHTCVSCWSHFESYGNCQTYQWRQSHGKIQCPRTKHFQRAFRVDHDREFSIMVNPESALKVFGSWALYFTMYFELNYVYYPGYEMSELFIKFNTMMLTVYGICNMHRMICLLLSNAAVSLVWALYHKWETITVRNLIQFRILQYCRHLMKSCLQWSIQSNAITEGLCVMSIIEL